MALTKNISPPGPEVAFCAPLLTFGFCGMEEGWGVSPPVGTAGLGLLGPGNGLFSCNTEEGMFSYVVAATQGQGNYY